MRGTLSKVTHGSVYHQKQKGAEESKEEESEEEEEEGSSDEEEKEEEGRGRFGGQRFKGMNRR